jgi:CBS-domain-containing membrane protein
MPMLRALIDRHRRLAVLLIMLALVIKAVVPAGYMLGVQGTVLTVTICADASGSEVHKQIVVPPKGTANDLADAHAKAPVACPYAALGFAALAGAVALAFVLALGLAPSRPVPLRRIAFLRPPLRGPPAFA